MSIRRTTLIILSLTFLISALIMAAAFNSIVLNSFQRLENQQIVQNIERLQLALEDELLIIEGVTADWGEWTDTYEFVSGEYDEYIDDNLMDESFTNLELNVMVYTNDTDELVIAKAVDLVTEEEAPIFTDLEAHLAAGVLLDHPDIDHHLQGIISTSEGLLLLSSQSVLTSDSEGPSRGTLVFGQYMDEEYVTDLSERLRLDLTLADLTASEVPEDIALALDSLSASSPTMVQALSEDVLAGYVLYHDIYGDPAFVLRVDMPRDVYAQGRLTALYIMVPLGVMGVLTVLMSLWLLERRVLARLVTLKTEVGDIARKRDQSGRVALSGEDELSELGTEINQMLAALERAQQELNLSELQNQAMLAAIPDTMLRINKDGVVKNYQVAEGEKLLIENFDLKGKNLQDMLETLKPIVPLEHLIEGLQALQHAQKQGTAEHEFPVKVDDTQYDYEARLVRLGETDETLVMVRNVTERKQAEQVERAATLLQEIHHRVKNNLQVITSLLSLQADRLEDKEVVSVLKDSQLRIESMGLIHAKLYQSRAMVGVDFTDYIRDLVGQLTNTYRLNPEQIKVELDLGQCFLDMEESIPCGMIVNELVSNALKHGFPDGRKGTLRVYLRENAGEISISISNDGRSLPEAFDLTQATSMGLQLVQLFTEQLDGEIEAASAERTVFRLTFNTAGG